MACLEALLNLERKDIVLIKPSNSIPTCILSLSTLDNKENNNNICQTVHVYVPSENHEFDSSFNPSHVLKEALSKALCYYYPFAGRLVKHAYDGKLRVDCNASSTEFGVPFLEANANCTLSSLHYLDNNDIEISKHLVLDLPSPQDKTYPLVLMVTKFLDESFTIGMGVSHAICDGIGSSQLFKAIVELANGRTEPSVKPVWERERLVGSITKQPFLQWPIDKKSIASTPFLNQTNATDIKLYCFKVRGEIIKKLKLSLMKESEKLGFTTFEALAGYVWRSRVRALKLSNNGDAMLDMLVAIRRSSKDCPLPKGYYGNSIVNGKVVLKVSEINEKPLYEIVKLIKDTKNVAFRADYATNLINFYETNREEDMSLELEASGAVTVLSEWKHLGFHNKDFGGYKAMNFVPVPCKMLVTPDVCIFLSPNQFDDDDDPSMKEGVRIFTSLPVGAMPKFRDEIEALKFL